MLIIVLAAALTVVGILPVASFFFFVPGYHFMLTSISEEESGRVAAHLAATIATNGRPITRDSLQPFEHLVIEELVKDFNLHKLRIFSDGGEIVFSTDSTEIGSRISDDYFYTEVARGKSLSKIVPRQSLSLEGQVRSIDVVETYVPVMDGGGFMGAVEIYSDISMRLDKYGWVIRRYLYTVFAVTGVLLAALFFVAYKARGYLRKRNRAEQALQMAHDEMERRVRERTAELKESNESLVKEIEMRTIFEAELALAAEVIDSIIEGICVTDSSGTVERVNRRFTEITGYTAKEAVGKNPRILKSTRHEPEFYEAMWRSLLTTGRWQGEIWNKRKNGEVYQEWLSISSIKNREKQTTHYVGVFYEVRSLLEKQQRLSRKAYQDPLTKLANRERFFERLNLALAHAHQGQLPLAVFFVDLDDFKAINDNLGHHCGDVMLQNVAARLLLCCREGDTVGRIGGDEFVMFLAEIGDRLNAAAVADRIFAHLAVPVTCQGKEMAIRASIGIALYPEHGEEADFLLNKADAAMYEAKKTGKNTYRFYQQATR